MSNHLAHTKTCRECGLDLPLGCYPHDQHSRDGHSSRCLACKRREEVDGFSVWPEGRVCPEEGCGTILSRYNAGPRCWYHLTLWELELRERDARKWQRAARREARQRERDELRELMEQAA